VSRPDQTPTYGEELERLSAAAAVLSVKLGADDYAQHRATGSALGLAASGRAAITAIRDLLGAHPPVVAE